jgi:hypothetical protein
MTNKTDGTGIGGRDKVIFRKGIGGEVFVVVDGRQALLRFRHGVAGEALSLSSIEPIVKSRGRGDRPVVARYAEFLRSHLPRAAASAAGTGHPEILAQIARFPFGDQHSLPPVQKLSMAVVVSAVPQEGGVALSGFGNKPEEKAGKVLPGYKPHRETKFPGRVMTGRVARFAYHVAADR